MNSVPKKWKNEGRCPKCDNRTMRKGRLCVKCARPEYKKRVIQKWIAEGRCRNCGNSDVPRGRRFCKNCGRRSLECTRRYRARYPEAFRRKYHELKKAGICVDCGAKKATIGVLCFICKLAERQRAVRVKKEAIDKYGGRCACCKEKRIAFLTMDHVNNDGTKMRKLRLHGGGGNLYKSLLRKPIDKSFQVLCWNCNMGKRVTGTCPHKDDNYFRTALARVRYERVETKEQHDDGNQK